MSLPKRPKIIFEANLCLKKKYENFLSIQTPKKRRKKVKQKKWSSALID